MNAGHGVDAPKTRIVEYNEFLSELDQPHDVLREPVNLYAKLVAKNDFNWELDVDATAKYPVVCQFRKSSATVFGRFVCSSAWRKVKKYKKVKVEVDVCIYRKYWQ